ncbi:hypothetical protein FMEAI12_2210016 [Parafrankia sp. Ea1.12]|nr:hypothetical protein FMEAI12_2210016 [Parafrankia sp. Ea1.12]
MTIGRTRRRPSGHTGPDEHPIPDAEILGHLTRTYTDHQRRPQATETPVTDRHHISEL